MKMFHMLIDLDLYFFDYYFTIHDYDFTGLHDNEAINGRTKDMR